jgi:hypothetical protein
MAKNILKEAIADAKAVREVALANAKAALEEAFTPKLQNMLSAKLSEDLDEDMYDEDGKELDLGEMEKDMDEMMYDEDDKDMDEMMYDEDDKDMDEMMYDEDEKEDSMDEEIDLEEILNELELEEGDKAEKEEDLEEVHRVGQPNYRGDGVHDVLNRASDINDNLAENKEFDLDSLLKEINDLEEEEEILEVEDDEKSLEEVINKRMNETKQNNECGCKSEKALANNLQFKLNESQKAYQTVRTELNEVNLLNSKLLYVNRIFKANNLSETQKLSVVETLDKATSVKEAKLIYETVKDTFTISNTNKSKPTRRKPIRENFKGMASKAIKTSAPRKPILKESNNMVARMQKLANINKINE